MWENTRPIPLKFQRLSGRGICIAFPNEHPQVNWTWCKYFANRQCPVRSRLLGEASDCNGAGTRPRALKLEIVLRTIAPQLEVFLDFGTRGSRGRRLIGRLHPLPRPRRLLLSRRPSFGGGLLARLDVVRR
jgi:hypothetical protein